MDSVKVEGRLVKRVKGGEAGEPFQRRGIGRGTLEYIIYAIWFPEHFSSMIYFCQVFYIDTESRSGLHSTWTGLFCGLPLWDRKTAFSGF